MEGPDQKTPLLEKGEAPEAEPPAPRDRRGFRDDDEDDYDVELLPTTRLRIEAAGALIDVSAQGPEGPQVIGDLVKVALDAVSKLQTNVN